MRSLGLIGLVLALLVVGFLVKKQMGGSTTAAVPTVRAQGEQIQQQVRQQLDAATQSRPMPDDAK